MAAGRILPFLRDLNPQLDDLPAIVRIIHRCNGDRARMTDAIYRLFKRNKRRRNFTRHSIEANTISSLGESNLGVIGVDGQLTSLGEGLRQLVSEPEDFRRRLTVHLLQERAGWQFCRALAVLGDGGKRPSREQVANFLASKYGIDEWRDLNNVSSLHKFLEWGGVVNKYVLNHDKFRELMSVTPADVAGYEEVSSQARDLFEALVRLGGKAKIGDIRTAAESIRGYRINVHQIPFLGQQLSQKGLIAIDTARGRRDTTWSVSDQPKAQAISRMSSRLSLAQSVPDDVFRRAFKDLLHDLLLVAGDKMARYRKGRILEIFAAKICWLLGLENIQVRRVSEYEVDVSGESITPVYAPWLIQCKATTGKVGTDVLLREYAIARLEGSHVVMVVTTADFSSDCRNLADRMQRAGVQVALLSGDDLERIAADETALYEIVRSQARRASRIKRGYSPREVLRLLDESAGEIFKNRLIPKVVWRLVESDGLLIPYEEFETLFAAWIVQQKEVGRAVPRFYRDSVAAFNPMPAKQRGGRAGPKAT